MLRQMEVVEQRGSGRTLVLMVGAGRELRVYSGPQGADYGEIYQAELATLPFPLLQSCYPTTHLGVLKKSI